MKSKTPINWKKMDEAVRWKKMDPAIRKALRNERHTLRIKDTAEYPLAFNVEMPEGHPYRNANISFRFDHFIGSGMSNTRIDKDRSFVDGDGIRICLEWKEIKIKAKYAINVREAPLIDLDTAGTLLAFNDQRDLLLTAGADAGNAPGLQPEEQQAFLDNARKQRTRLMDTPNGQQLMGIYNEHNEVYNEVFVNSEAARTTWQADGATAEMAKDTHAAVQNNGVVNSGSRTYAGGVSYNSNAFVQQLNICVNTANADPDFNPWDPNAKPDPNSKYIKASLAALSFGKAVNTTGNDDKKVTPLKAEDVYTHVNNFAQPAPKTDIGELQNILSQGNNPAGGDEAAEKGWMILDEEQRKMVRRWIHMGIRQKANAKSSPSSPLWEGDCTAFIRNSSVMIDLAYQPGNAKADLKSTRPDLPVFEFEIDDAAWTGTAATIVRERLGRLYFIKSLIASQVAAGIRTIAALAVADAFNAG